MMLSTDTERKANEMLSKDAVVKLIEDDIIVYLVDLNSRSISLGIVKKIVPSEYREDNFYYEYCITEKKGVQYRIIDSLDHAFTLCRTKKLAVKALMAGILLDIEEKVKYINKMVCEFNKYGEEFGILLSTIHMPRTTSCTISEM
jgi:hypothetical protein